MKIKHDINAVDQRMGSLLAKYTDPLLATAELLCDKHPTTDLAFRIITEGFIAQNFSFGEVV